MLMVKMIRRSHLQANKVTLAGQSDRATNILAQQDAANTHERRASFASRVEKSRLAPSPGPSAVCKIFRSSATMPA